MPREDEKCHAKKPMTVKPLAIPVAGEGQLTLTCQCACYCVPVFATGPMVSAK